MDKETKRIYLLLLQVAIVFAIVGFYMSWLDNGPRWLF